MPSVLIGNPVASGPQIIISGNPWSGNPDKPVGYILFRLDSGANGNVYLGLSGGTTLLSGGMFLSGGGLNDGFVVPPGRDYQIPALAFNLSGTYNVYARHDAACSGQGRLFYEIY